MRILIVLLVVLFCLGAAPSPTRILVIGDSLSRGVAAPHNAGFAYLVAAELDAELGIMSSGSLFGAEQDWPEWKWRDVDLIIIELSLHDIGGEAGLISDAEWQARYGLLLDLLHQETGARVIAVTTFWTGVTEAENAERYNRTLMYNDFIKQASEGREFARMADVWGATEGCTECISGADDKNPWATLDFRGDNFHPGRYGHQAIADEILKTWRGWYRVYLPIFTP